MNAQLSSEQSRPDLRNAPRRVSELAPKLDRLPPHSVEAEQGVIGCLLLSPRDCISEALQTLTAQHFYDLRHRALWDCLVEMFEDDKVVDQLTVAQKLRDEQKLDGVGGLGYIASLLDMVPSAANLEYYINIVHEKYLLRKTINICTEVIQRVYDYEGNGVDELLGDFESEVHSLCNTNTGRKERGMKELVNEAIGRIELLHERQGEIIGLSTGLIDLDKETWGAQDGQLWVIAARPSCGKTSLLTQIVDHVAVEKKVPAAIFSFETTDTNLTMRMLCARARVNLRRIREGHIAERDFPKLTGAAGKVAQAPIHIIEASGWSVQRVRSKARQLHAQGVRLFGLDYLQLVLAGKTCTNREQEVAHVSAQIKASALELHAPWIVLAQLNREIEKGAERKPKMSDLRESGQIEQDADLIGLLYKRPGEEQADEGIQPTNLLIAKQKDGDAGIDVELLFHKGITRFESVSRVNPNDVPAEA